MTIGLMMLASSSGTHIQQAKSKDLYLVKPEIQNMVPLTQGLGYRLDSWYHVSVKY